MQSEIDEIRACLKVMRILNSAGELDKASCHAGIDCIEQELAKIELQQAVNQDMVRLPVMTLAQVAAGAARDLRHRLTVIEGGRQ